MCRLTGVFAKPTASPPKLKPALVGGENGLRKLSSAHNVDGHGVAWVDLETGEQHVHRSILPAIKDDGFEAAVTKADGNTRVFLGHVREQTQGETSLLNTHPFTHGRWAFIHNGNLDDFPRHQARVLDQIAPDLAEQIQGNTDSEHAFFLFLTRLGEISSSPDAPTAHEATRAMEQTLEILARLTNRAGQAPSAMNFVATTPELMVATRYNRQLAFSDRLAPGRSAEVLDHGAVVPGLAVASEPWAPSLGWTAVPERTVLAVDADSRLIRREFAKTELFPLGMTDKARRRLGKEASWAGANGQQGAPASRDG